MYAGRLEQGLCKTKEQDKAQLAEVQQTDKVIEHSADTKTKEMKCNMQFTYFLFICVSEEKSIKQNRSLHKPCQTIKVTQ